MKRSLALIITIILLAILGLISRSKNPSLPCVAIANLGPHASLENCITGIIDELSSLGYRDGEEIRIVKDHVNFDPNLILQMLSKLKSCNPEVLVTLTTPVTQAARGRINDIPQVFSLITDPAAAGLLKDKKLTGISDAQDLDGFLLFALSLLPQAKTMGLLYSTSEANDQALVKFFQQATQPHQLELMAIPLSSAGEVPMRMEGFRGKVDFIYTGSSGAVQSAFPAIISSANAMNIPVFDFDEGSVLKHQALGSFAVSYYELGRHTAQMVVAILKGKKTADIPPYFPKTTDHRALVSTVQLEKFKLRLPEKNNIILVPREQK